jgi:hypothetical protein
MPNPFPGMNPYLEDPLSWRDVHTSLLTYLREALQPQLGPNYVARLEEAVEIEDDPHRWMPDVLIVEENGGNGSHGAATASSVATIAKPLILELPEEPPARRIEILDVRSREVVTTIEVLSPSNKSSAGYGDRNYLNKIQSLWRTPASIVEIDLLRAGLPVTSAEMELHPRRIPPHDYLVSVSRGHQRGRYEVYPFSVRDAVPPVAIPLRKGEDDVLLELTPLIHRVYEVGAYERLIDYNEAPPLPSLGEADSQWLDALLKEKGLRVKSEKTEESTS